jgi:hypothetical protein
MTFRDFTSWTVASGRALDRNRRSICEEWNMSFTLDDLDMALGHISEAQRHVAAQEQRILRLKAAGVDTELAKDLLGLFYQTLTQHRCCHDLVAADLAIQQQALSLARLYPPSASEMLGAYLKGLNQSGR